jgi:hypothetical protein
MIALTTRLNERDEAILQMQEELDAFDKIHRDSEQGRMQMGQRILTLERFIRSQNLEVPVVSEEDLVDSPQGGDRVRLGDCETFNVTDSNLLSPEEKIKTLVQIADNRKNEIQQLKDQIKNLEDNSNQNCSRETASRKGTEESYRPLEEISVIASSVNEIIQKLSQQNNADVMKYVAKKLLDLQKYTADITRKG